MIRDTNALCSERERQQQHEAPQQNLVKPQHGPEDGFSGVQCHDISPPTRKQPSDHVPDVTVSQDPEEVIQELELVHFLLTELNQRKNKCAPVKELRGYLMVSIY